MYIAVFVGIPDTIGGWNDVQRLEPVVSSVRSVPKTILEALAFLPCWGYFAGSSKPCGPLLNHDANHAKQ
jgi:hypothetical protein